MRRTRQVLAVMLVTTALCADRGAAALSVGQARAQTDSTRIVLTGSFLERLSRTLGRTVAVVLPRRAESVCRDTPIEPAVLTDQLPQPARLAVTPFQFRLPPPAC